MEKLQCKNITHVRCRVNINKGFKRRWITVELMCYVKTITVSYINFTTSFVGGIL